jgi:LmbE family N-acetylglucosaminyl deacetylase
MTIFAHPDDMEFSCGATLAKWAAAGCEITVVLCTSGNVGTHDVKFTPYTLAALREEEQKKACDVLGIKHIEFLRHDDSRLVADLTLRRELVHLIRKYKPEVVFCGDPHLVFWGNNRINHPDHRAAARAALQAIFPCASMALFCPDAGPVPEVHGVYVRAFEQLDTWIDVTDTIELKIKALREHHCQLDDYKDLEETMRQRAMDAGKEKGMAFAESFRVVRLKE